MRFRLATLTCSPASEYVSANRSRSRDPNSLDSNTRVRCSHTHIQARNHILAPVSAPAEPDAERNSRSSLVVPGRQVALCRSALRKQSVQVPHKPALRSRSQVPPNQRPIRQPLKTLKRLFRERELYS